VNIVVRPEGAKVMVNIDSRVYLELEPRAAQQLAAALQQAGLVADEVLQAERIARDSAILMRAGEPFTLSDNPKILAEAAKQAAWDRELRTAMPGGVKSESIVGLPSLVPEPPKGVQ
jgi:hypothetical protein